MSDNDHGTNGLATESNGMPSGNEPRPGNDGATEEIVVEGEDFTEATRIVADLLDPPELRAIQPHVWASAGVAYTRSDPTNGIRLTQLVARALFNEDQPTAAHQAVQQRLKDISTASLIQMVKGQVEADVIDALPNGFQPDDAMTRAAGLKKLATSSGPLTHEVEQAATRSVHEAMAAILVTLNSLVMAAPRTAARLIASIHDVMAKRAASAPDPQPKIKALEGLAARYREVAGRSAELSSDVLRQVRVRLVAEMRKADAAAVDALLGRLCNDALRRAIPRAVEQLAALGRQANARAMHQQGVLDALIPPRSETESAGPGGGGVVIDDSGGRAITLPGRELDELTTRVLSARGVSSVDELARAYREELGSKVAPESQAAARALASELRRMVAKGCGTESVFSLIADERNAREIAAALYPRAHPFVSLRMTEEELNVCKARVEWVELPITDNPAHVPIRKAFADELLTLSGNRVRVVDRPPGVPSIRVLRSVCGYPSLCDRTNDPLDAAYRLLTNLGFDAHPFGSPLKALLAGREVQKGSRQ